MNIIVLIGSIQGLVLCLYLFPRRKSNINGYTSFCVFLGSLVLFNFGYALIYSDIWVLSNIPLPYKYLIGVGFYFFIKYHITNENHFKKEFYLFLPALLYGLLRSYWFVIGLTKDPSIIRHVYDTGFFTYNEFAYLTFNLVLVLKVIHSLRQQLKGDASPVRISKRLLWLEKTSRYFFVFTTCHFLAFSFSVLNNELDSIYYYYPILFLNSGYIYFIGYLGFTKQKHFFTSASEVKSGSFAERNTLIEQKIQTAIIEEQLYKRPKLKLAELAVELSIPTKELSEYFNTTGLNFSEYLNVLRIEEVKKLLKSDKKHLFTMEALAKDAGFNSKTSFNTSFKRIVGLTPTEYLKQF